jgi:hypothetical protein
LGIPGRALSFADIAIAAKALNDWGRQGWEAVAVVRQSGGQDLKWTSLSSKRWRRTGQRDAALVFDTKLFGAAFAGAVTVAICYVAGMTGWGLIVPPLLVMLAHYLFFRNGPRAN